jgi:hypothetical protein
MIVAWRDPFWLVSDGLETDGTWGATSPSGPKIKPIPGSALACGISGLGREFGGVIEQLAGLLSDAPSWGLLEWRTRAVVDSINEPLPDLHRGVTVVVAGTLDGARDLFAWGPESATRVGPNDSALGFQCAFAGSGGLYATIAHQIASSYWPDVAGEALLRTIAEIAADTDPHSGRPIYRIDLDGPTLEPHVWIK